MGHRIRQKIGAYLGCVTIVPITKDFFMFLALILQNFKQNKFADSRKSFLNCTALGKICLSRLWLKLDLIWPLIDYILFLAFKQTWHNLHWLIDWLIERERERERERENEIYGVFNSEAALSAENEFGQTCLSNFSFVQQCGSMGSLFAQFLVIYNN